MNPAVLIHIVEATQCLAIRSTVKNYRSRNTNGARVSILDSIETNKRPRNTELSDDDRSSWCHRSPPESIILGVEDRPILRFKFNPFDKILIVLGNLKLLQPV